LKISYFSKGIVQTEPDQDRELTEILSDIKGLALSAVTSALRKEKDENRQAILKARLPYTTWSGKFAHRKKKDPFLQHSGLLCLDFDSIENIKATRTKIEKDQFTKICFISPRGNGLKVVIAIPAEPENHERYFNTAREYFKQNYGLEADESGKDVSRACFLCHDSRLFYNSKSELFDSIREPAKVQQQEFVVTLDGLEALDPVDRGDYYDLTCPKCGRKDAYLYKNGWMLKCSHVNSCGFEENILEKRIEAKITALQVTPKSKKLRFECYSLIRFVDDIERAQHFKKIGAIFKVSIDAVRKDFENKLQEKASSEFQTDAGMKFAQPLGWTITPSGVLDIKKRQITYSPIYVNALGYSRKGDTEYIELVYQTNGTAKTRAIPRKSIAIVSELLEQSSYGVPVTSANALDVVRFLDAWIAANRASLGSFIAIEQLGWDGNHFIMPDRIIGDHHGDATIHFIESTVDKGAYSRAGTLDAWVETIKELSTFPDAVVGRFLIYAGFAGLVLEPLGRRPFIIHLHGDTSTSKTTALRMVASIFGNPVEGKAMIKWFNTMNFITRYMEKLKNIPLIIDESSGETKNIFEQVIYQMESGLGKGKALKSDPFGTAALRSFRCAVFSSGEPPVLSEQFMSGAQIRVIEFDASPWGGELTSAKYERWFNKLMANYGHAIDPFIERFIELKDTIDWETTLPGDDTLTSVENRVKKNINLIWLCGTIVNELFDFRFDVDKDCVRIFEMMHKELDVKAKSADRIMADVHDFYFENQFYFINTVKNEFGKITSEPNKHQGKVYGYKFGDDLAIIKSVFKEAMNSLSKQPNAGDWAIHRLKKKNYITDNRTVKVVDGYQQSFVYFYKFFEENSGF